jgi:hypothetical protein
MALCGEEFVPASQGCKIKTLRGRGIRFERIGKICDPIYFNVMNWCDLRSELKLVQDEKEGIERVGIGSSRIGATGKSDTV